MVAVQRSVPMRQALPVLAALIVGLISTSLAEGHSDWSAFCACGMDLVFQTH